MAFLMLLAYRVLGWIALAPLCFAVRKHPNFKGTIASRLALSMPERRAGELVWLHCSSLGEVKAAELLIEALRKVRPGLLIYVSSMTATGREAAQKIAGLDCVFPFPFDLAPVMRRYIDHLKPSAVIIVETEIWPNLLNEAHKRKVPVAFINARMSEKSARNYGFIKPLMAGILCDTSVLAISDADAGRFASLGAVNVSVLGNIKFDAVRSADVSNREALKAGVNAAGMPVFIAGSVREGEEKYVVDAIKFASEKVGGLVSIIAPRHPDRVGLLCDMLKDSGMGFSLRSSGERSDVVVVDTMGELFRLYGASDVAFVGGSLVDLGGQNILEPLAWGVPTIHGQYMSNFLWALDVVGRYTVKVEKPEDLGAQIVEVLGNIRSCEKKAEGALNTLSKFKGISMQYAVAIVPILEKQ